MNTVFNKRILFVGIPDMAFICLDACLQVGVNIVGVMGPKPDHHMYEAFKSFAKNKGLNYIEYTDLTAPELVKTIKGLNIDLAVVASFNYKIPEELLNATKDGFINIHPSLLPEYKGSNPYARVIMNNEKFTGVTLHHMDKEFDTGDIILQIKCPIDNDETMGTLFNKTNRICVELLLATLKEYEERQLPSIPQPQGTFKTAKNVSEKEMFLDYNKPAIELERKIRALNPFILASTMFREHYIKIMKAEVINKQYPDDIENGTIVNIKDNKTWIKTSKGCIAFNIIQYDSFFIGDNKDFIKKVKPVKGERFY